MWTFRHVSADTDSVFYVMQLHTCLQVTLHNKVLRTQHVIPFSMVCKRWLELIDASVSPADQRAFHDHLFEVVCVTVVERQKLDWKLKLMFKLNSMVNYSDNLVL